ncbi:MAG TPA: filamentous hemagglutinin N-terminal domain-containing protein, partial [Candidatus Binataceae bacterium]|nr:filamentous hemagglutinin N-terminal domain-containing protein [Candidatus Binataceae bacterium]
MAGQASVSRSGTNTLVTQGTDRAAINWLGFDIAADESVRFAQPSASSIALNRVLGQNPTEIFGSLTANGQVFILNPNGVLFGKGAQVDVAGLVASTLSLSNEDFMAGRYRFTASAAAGLGEVANQGDITANGG